MKSNTLRHKRVLSPKSLQTIYNAPTHLFICGKALESHVPHVAIVGSRRPTPYGKLVTEHIAGELAQLGVVIVSGLAFGIDTIAHKAALAQGGRTIAVLPSGIDTIYPASNRHLAWQIATENGSLITEYPEGHVPRKHDFLARNRLISGLSQAVVIVEAAQRSGTLSTAHHALQQTPTGNSK